MNCGRNSRAERVRVWAIALAMARAFLFVGGSACHGQGAPLSPATAAQQREIDALLHRNPQWRAATAADHVGNPDEVRRLRAEHAAYTPYFASAASDEREGSFAIALVRDTMFRVVYFPFRERGYGSPIEVATAGWFREAHLALYGDTLRIAAFRSDVILDLVWSERAGKFVLVEDSTASPRPR